MKRLLIAAALGAMLPTPSFATCARYPDGLPVQHWQLNREEMRRSYNGHASAQAEAFWARAIAEAELCQKDAISYLEYDARIAGISAQIDEAYRRQRLQYSQDRDPIFSCDPAPGGGFDCM